MSLLYSFFAWVGHAVLHFHPLGGEAGQLGINEHKVSYFKVELELKRNEWQPDQIAAT